MHRINDSPGKRAPARPLSRSRVLEFSSSRALELSRSADSSTDRTVRISRVDEKRRSREGMLQITRSPIFRLTSPKRFLDFVYSSNLEYATKRKIRTVATPRKVRFSSRDRQVERRGSSRWCWSILRAVCTYRDSVYLYGAQECQREISVAAG